MINPSSPVFFSAKLPLYGHTGVCVPCHCPVLSLGQREIGLHPAVKSQPLCAAVFDCSEEKKETALPFMGKSGLMDFRSVHTAPP